MDQQQPSRIGRRLAAIVAADVAGYSRLMGLDEVGTARTLREHRKVTDALVEKHGGRLVKSTGDGVLLEFPSVVDAVECCVAVQEVMAQRNEGVPVDRQMLFRIGINLGDILIEGDDILGDGVNVAARLEGIAEPGGICLSSTAYEHVRGKVAVEFTDLGEQTLKNIARPIRAYAIGSSVSAHQTGPLPTSAPHLSLVVLPFANIRGDHEQEYFADGVTESLTTDLSRISGAFVVARNTAFTFKGRAVDIKKLGRELNVRYVLEGSVQRASNRLRVNVQLIDAETGNHLWAERFDKPVADLFDMQDEIVSRLANTLGASLVEEEARRSERASNPNSMDLCFQGKARWNKGLAGDLGVCRRSMHRICKSEAIQPGSDGHRRRREQDRRRRHLNHIIGHFAFAIRCSHDRYSPLLLSRFSRFPPSLRTFRPNLCPRRMDHWSASKIAGKILASEPAPKTGAIPWLLSSADSSGSGILAGANVSRSARDKALRVHSKPAIAVLALMSVLGPGSR
jgi:TolB-like protein